MELSHLICGIHPVFCCSSSIEYCYTGNGRFLNSRKEWFYLSVRERILAIRIMEKLRKFPEQADVLGIVAANRTSNEKCRAESEKKLLETEI